MTQLVPIWTTLIVIGFCIVILIEQVNHHGIMEEGYWNNLK